jgi:heme exporter protein A
MILSGHGLSCQRGGRLVFAGLVFSIGPGGGLLLTGPNGSGKSSLLRMLAGLLAPAGGELRIDDRDVREDPDQWRRSVAFVGHHDPVKPVMTVREHLAFWSVMTGGGDVVQAMEAFDLAHLASTPGRFLSAGQKRRANLARLMVSDAPLWLLDEPSTALDAASTQLLEDAMAAHREAGGMIIASSHIPLGLGDADSLDLGWRQDP